MKSTGSSLLLGALVLALAGTCWGQRASNWRVYRIVDGLPEPACLSVSVLPHGKVLARQLNRPCVSELTGYDIEVIPIPPMARGRVYESPSGQLWTMVREGLLELKDNAWTLHPLPEIAAEYHGGPNPIPMCPVRQGQVLYLLPDRLMEFTSVEGAPPRTRALRLADQGRIGKFLGLVLGRDGELWLAGAQGLAHSTEAVRSLKPESRWEEYVAPGELGVRLLREPHEEEDGSITSLAESDATRQKRIVNFDRQHWVVEGVGAEKIQNAWRSPAEMGWAFSPSALFQWERGAGRVIENEEILARQYFDVAFEPNGAFWLATSDGLCRYAPLCWRKPALLNPIQSLVHALRGDPEDRLWFVAGAGLYALQGERLVQYPFPGELARQLQSARTLLPLKHGSLVLEAEAQLFAFHPATGAFAPIAAKGNAQHVILGRWPDGALCVQNLAAAGDGTGLELFDGNQFEPLTNPPPAALGVPTILFAAQNGDLWFGSGQGTAWYHDKKWRLFTALDKTEPETVVGFVELADGKLWCATEDKIWEFNGRNWLMVRTGFERISSLVRAQRDGSIWVASNTGLHRFFQGAWIENGIEEGLPSLSVWGLHEDQRGQLWAATTRGLCRYFPEADPDPPRTRIQELRDNEKNIPESSAFVISFTGRDRWKFTPRERLLFSFRLDERDWSAFSERDSVLFNDLPPGKHLFQARAMDRNGNIEPKPAQLEFMVVLPWYQETRLLTTALAGLALVLFFAGLAFNRHRRLLKSYAEVEQKVRERTRELEIANRELVFSQKMNALGALAAGIAHDFNNILSIIKGSAQIIEDNLDNPRKVAVRVDRIKTVVEQGAGIVKAMLGFSRNGESRLALCEPNAMVEDTIRLLGDRFLREVQVEFTPAPALPPVPAYREFVQQVLLNFIFNAAESMAKRKQIRLATRELKQLPPDLVLLPAAAPAYVVIAVQDFGCGIAPEILPRIFEPFFTTKALSARRGTGLGLSMAYELAKKLAAGLAVESVVDQGSTFSLILPVRELPVEAATPTP